MDPDQERDGPVRQFLANMPLTMEGHEVLSFRDVDTPEDAKLARVLKQRRLEAILKSVFVQLALDAGDKPMSVEMTRTIR